MRCLKNEIRIETIDWEHFYLVVANKLKAWLEGLLIQNLEILNSNASFQNLESLLKTLIDLRSKQTNKRQDKRNFDNKREEAVEKKRKGKEGLLGEVWVLKHRKGFDTSTLGTSQAF